MEISRLNALLNTDLTARVVKPDTADQNQASPAFGDVLKQALNQVESDQKAADDASLALATGQTTDLSQVMLATQKADLSLSLAVQVRNKVLDAYQEIMRMPL
ncbi:MAG: flagellar hook-basal body complex protein FliE [Mycobacterium leprae]